MESKVWPIRIDNDLFRRVKALAEKEKRTIGGTIIWVLRCWFERVRKTKEVGE